MAENYPAALQAYHNPLYRPFLFNNAWLPRKYEELSLAQLQHVFVVADEQKCRLVKLGVPSEKLTLVGNTPTDSFIASSAEGNVSLPSDSHPHLLYVGKLDRHRGAHLLVRALPALLAEFPKLRLSLVGDGNDKLRLETLARETGVMEAVSLPGWIERAKLPALIRESTVCLIPHTRCEHTDTTLPNKLFDYLAYSKPTIASDCLPLRRVIEDEDCGTTFRSGDVSSLLAAIRSLLRDPYLKSKGINGRIAVERKYNWNLDKERLLNALERVACSWQAP
jgi:glycosyltransferase involved in cell wall biosynthesis